MLNTYDRDGVTVVELDRGPVNAFDLELLGALTAAFDRADSPVVLTGAGRTFSAGVDLRRIVEEPDSYVAEFLAALARAFLAVFTHPRPTVAAINGHAIAGGCRFAVCCDTRVMGAGTIGLTELAGAAPRRGGDLPGRPDLSAVWRLVLRGGEQRARRGGSRPWNTPSGRRRGTRRPPRTPRSGSGPVTVRTSSAGPLFRRMEVDSAAL